MLMTGPSVQTHLCPRWSSPRSRGERHATRHLVLQRYLALHASLLGKARHAHHHRLRTAGGNHIKLLVLQHRVVGYETHLAGRAILGGNAYLAYLGKLVELQQVGILSRPSRKVTSAPKSLIILPK